MKTTGSKNIKDYKENPDEFQGWIELEDNFPPKELM